jgi:hypothetical protein
LEACGHYAESITSHAPAEEQITFSNSVARGLPQPLALRQWNKGDLGGKLFNIIVPISISLRTRSVSLQVVGHPLSDFRLDGC